jgi:hypothetical protein
MSEMLPVGNYNGQIEGHDLTALGDKGTPCVVFDVVLRDGKDSDKQHVDCEGVRKKILMWLTDKALPYTVKNIRSLGYTKGDIKGLAMEHEETSGLVGVQVRISCKHAEDHNGVLRERLGMFVAANNSKPLAADTLSVFAKLFREEQQKLTTQEESSDVDDNEEEEPVVVAPPKKATQTGTKQPARVARSKGGYQTPF